MYNLLDCTLKEFAHEAVKKGGSGYPVCLITQMSVGSIAAVYDLKITSISRTYDTKNGTCERATIFEEKLT